MPSMNDDRPYLSAVSDGASDVATVDGDDEPSALDILEPDFNAEPHGRVEIMAENADDEYAEDAVGTELQETDRLTIVDADIEISTESAQPIPQFDKSAAELTIAQSVEVVEESPATDLITGLEADIDLVEAAMSHLDNNDLGAADEAVSQLDRGAEPTLFAAVVAPVDEAE